MVPPFSVALHALCIWCIVLVLDIRGVTQKGVPVVFCHFVRFVGGQRPVPTQ